jgi:hypothetical protein
MVRMKCLNVSRVGIILALSMSIFAAAQLKRDETGRGGEWLSWTPVQRHAYVYGLVDGYSIGFGDACQLTNQLFETNEAHRLGNDPSGRCMAHRGEFSNKSFDKAGHLDLSAYTDVITAFYNGHPGCRDFPFSFLLQSLGSKYATADQLYQMALKGEFEHYPRSRQWCGSGDLEPPKP